MQEIFRPMNRKSEVWAYFGFVKDANGQLVGLPICNACRNRIKTKGGNTTNLMNHLRDRHAQLYRQLKVSLHENSDNNTSRYKIFKDKCTRMFCRHMEIRTEGLEIG